MTDNSIFVTGYAKLPHGITATELYAVIAVGMIIDRQTGIIEDIDCSLVTSVARSFIKALVVGKNILDYEEWAIGFSDRYHGSARKALLSAFKIINEKYRNLLNDN